MSTPTNTPVPQATTHRAWPVLLLALPAFVAIWSGWVELGRLTGFGPVSPLPGIWDSARIDTAITLPVGVETYAAYALHVWLARDVSDRARKFARVSAIGSLILGAAGQVAFHLMSAAGMVRAPWWITALVACLPVAVLGMGAALAHLVAEAPAEREDQGEDAEDRTARAVIVNALRERHPQWPAETVTAATEDLAPGESLPTPAPRAVASITPTRVRSGAKTRSNAEKARDMKAKYPHRTHADIAGRLGVTERTVERYFSPAATAPAGPVTSPAAIDELAA